MNNEEKILQVLETQGKILEQHGKLLENINGRLAGVETLSQRTAVLLETEYADKLQLLFDGHMEIMQKMDDLTPKSRVEALEDDVSLMKTVIRALSQEVAELKKAQ